MAGRKRQIRQAVILAGGAGTRLQPFTKALPKALMPVGETPIVEVLVRQLARDGIREIIVALGHGADLIRLFLGDGAEFGVKIRFVAERRPLGTAGPLRTIEGLQRDFLVLNGDILTTLDFAEFGRFHLTNRAPVSIAACRRRERSDYGEIRSRGGQVVAYQEKPTRSVDVSMGVYGFSAEILRHIPRRRFDFPELISTLLALELRPAMYRFSGTWLDIGREDDWRRASRLYSRNPGRFV